MPERVSRISVKWQSDSPFFAEFLLRINFTEDSGVPTIGITLENNSLKIFYNKEFLETLSNIELESILVHEILHILHKFQERLGSRDHKIFNIAQDACINDTIEKTFIGGTKLKLPEAGVRMKDIVSKGYSGPVVTEPVYTFLEDNAERIEMYVLPQNGEGLCPTDDHSLQKDLTELEKQAISEITRNAKMRNYGNISKNLVDTIESLTKSKQIPWRRKLAMLMSRYTSDPGEIYENTWSKRNRRGIPLPGIRKLSKKIVITIDTSGSIDQEQLSMFFSQIEKILKDYSCITLIQWDTKVNSVSKYRKGFWKKTKIEGRGGTAVQCVYDYVKENLKNTNLIVNFTDGFFDWNVSHYNIPTIWALTSKDVNISFGKKVYIEKESKVKYN